MQLKSMLPFMSMWYYSPVARNIHHLPFNTLFQKYPLFSPRRHKDVGSHNPIPPQNRNSTIPASFKYPKHSAENEGRTLYSTAYPLDNRTDKSKQKESSRLRPLPHQGFGLGREWEGDCCGFRSGWPGESKRGGRFPSSCVLLMPRLLEWSWI